MNNNVRKDLEKIDFSLIVMQGTLTAMIVLVACIDHEISREFLEKVQIPSVVASALTFLHFCIPYEQNQKDS